MIEEVKAGTAREELVLDSCTKAAAKSGGVIATSVGSSAGPLGQPNKQNGTGTNSAVSLPPIRVVLGGQQSGSPATSSQDDFELSEGGNAQRLIKRHGNVMRYCVDSNSWYYWTGNIWSPESKETPNVMRLAKDILADIRGHISTLTDKARIKEAESFLKRTNSTAGLRGAIRYAISERDVALSYSVFDQDKSLLNCINGTVDLRTGQLKQHDRNDLITRTTPVVYNPSALCPLWEKTLIEVFDNDQDLISFFQKALGYSLSGDTKEKAFFFLHGAAGNNGKSMILAVLRELLGDYAVAVAPATILRKKFDGIPSDVAKLAGTRFAIAEETEHGKVLNESLIKQITGGPGTRMTARFLYHDFFEFEPLCKLFIATNHRVAMNPEDSIFNRIRVIPFNIQFLDAQKLAVRQQEGRKNVRLMDNQLYGRLLGELPGILNWAIDGYSNYVAQGLSAPASVVEATANYREDVDVIGRYLSERVECDAARREACRKVYQDYRDWCNNSGEKPVSQCELTKRLVEKGVNRTDKPSTGGYHFYLGVRLMGSP